MGSGEKEGVGEQGSGWGAGEKGAGRQIKNSAERKKKGTL